MPARKRQTHCLQAYGCNTFLEFQAEAENFHREYLKAQKEAEEYENALYERVQDYVCKMKKEELRQALLELLFGSPEWQFD